MCLLTFSWLLDITDHRVAVAHKGHLFHPGVNKASLTRLWSCLEVMFIAFGKRTHGNMEVKNKRKTQQSNTQKHTHKHKKNSGTGLMYPVNNGVTISHSEKCNYANLHSTQLVICVHKVGSGQPSRQVV